MTCAKAQVEMKGWFSGMSVGSFNARLIKSRLMEHTQTLTRSQKMGEGQLHCPACSEPCVLQAGQKRRGLFKFLVYVRQVSNGQDKKKLDKVFIRQSGTGKCTRQETWSVSLFSSPWTDKMGKRRWHSHHWRLKMLKMLTYQKTCPEVCKETKKKKKNKKVQQFKFQKL